jgi:hypothetical protein
MMKNNEMMKQMEYLVKLLHKEWEKSGKTKVEAVVNLGDLSDFGIEIDKRVADTISMMNEAQLSFGETLEYSKENYVLLRLAKKMVKAQRRCKDKGIDFKVKIPLDKEELQMYQEIAELV